MLLSVRLSVRVCTVQRWCHSESPRQGTRRALTVPGHVTFARESPQTALSTGRLSHFLTIISIFISCIQGSLLHALSKLAIVVFTPYIICISIIRLPGLL